MLALEVAASAPSPRKRPTQMALMVPFSDWRIEEASVGSANLSSVEPMPPWVRSPRAAFAMLEGLPSSLRHCGHSKRSRTPAMLD